MKPATLPLVPRHPLSTFLTPVIIYGMADGQPPLSSKNEQHQPLISPEPAPRLQHALPPIAAPEYAPPRKRMTGILILIGIVLMAFGVWVMMIQ